MGCQCAKKSELEQQNEITYQKNTQAKSKALPNESNEIPKQLQETKDIEPASMSPPVQEPPKVDEKIEKIEAPKQKEPEPQYVQQIPLVASIEPISQEFPKDDFSTYIFEHINKLRTNPSYIIPEIESGMENITKEKNKKNPNEEKLIYKSKVKVALTKGKEAFEEAISILKTVQPMEPLIFKENMCLPVPTTEEEFKDKEFLKNNVSVIKGQGINIDNAWKDLVKDAETSFLLMVVDDSGKKAGMKRNDILNPSYKYVGISSTMIGKSFVAFCTFSK